jgi:hypothetical protein
MRDFNNLSLIERIRLNPNDFIVHRKVDLLDSFIFGYEHILLKIKDIEILKNKYKNIPSMQEHAQEIYNGNIGSRNFKSILEYNCENELEYYNKYIQFIKDYESKYTLENNIEYIIEQQYELKDILNKMRKRYPMYFNNFNLENFRAFFDGYITCKKENNIEIDYFEYKIITFLQNIKCEIIEMEDKNITWDRKYTYNKSFSSLDGNKEIINKFFEGLEKNAGEKI